MVNISVRQFAETDWEVYRAIRLEALAKHPSVFNPGSDETAFPEEVWRKRLANIDAAHFGVFDGPQLVGLTGIAIDPNDQTTAYSVSSYLKEAYRGQRITESLFEAALNWIRTKPAVKKVIVSHRRGNLASQRAILKYGFTHESTGVVEFLDGTTDENLVYKIEL